MFFHRRWKAQTRAPARGFSHFPLGFPPLARGFPQKGRGVFANTGGIMGFSGEAPPAPVFDLQAAPAGRRSFWGFGAPGFSVGKLVCSPAPFLKNFSLSFDALGALLGASAPPAFLLGNLFVLLRLFLKIFLCPSTRSGRAGAPTFWPAESRQRLAKEGCAPFGIPPLRSR